MRGEGVVVVRILQSLIAGKEGGGRKSGKFHCDTTNILRPPTDQKQLLWQIMTVLLHWCEYELDLCEDLIKQSLHRLEPFLRNHHTWISNNSTFWPNHCGQFWSRRRTILDTVKLHHHLNFPSSSIMLGKPFHRHHPCDSHQSVLEFFLELLKDVRVFSTLQKFHQLCQTILYHQVHHLWLQKKKKPDTIYFKIVKR